MKTIKPLSPRELIRALIRLHNTSQGKTVDSAGLVRQNVSSWLNGRDDAISEDKVLHLMNTLGVSSGLLRTDMVHRWCVKDIKDVSDVLATVGNPQLEVNLLKTHLPSHPASSIIQITDDNETAWILLYRPALDLSPVELKAKEIGCGKTYDISIDKEVWISWLPPNLINLNKFHATVSKIVLQAMISKPINDDKGGDKMLLLYHQARKKMTATEILTKTKAALDL